MTALGILSAIATAAAAMILAGFALDLALDFLSIRRARKKRF